MGSRVASSRAGRCAPAVLLIVTVLSGLLVWCCAFGPSDSDDRRDVATTASASTAVSAPADHHDCTELPSADGTADMRAGTVSATPASAIRTVIADRSAAGPSGSGTVDPSPAWPPGDPAARALLCVWRT